MFLLYQITPPRRRGTVLDECQRWSYSTLRVFAVFSKRRSSATSGISKRKRHHLAQIPLSLKEVDIDPLVRRCSGSLDRLGVPKDQRDRLLLQLRNRLNLESASTVPLEQTALAFPATSPPPSNDAIAWWVTGLTDGEGCFHAHFSKGHLGVMFKINQRADNIPMAEWLLSYFRVGSLRLSLKPGKALKANPVFIFAVTNTAGLLRVVEHFDKYPLQGKKRKDFEIWREIVLLKASKMSGPAKVEKLEKIAGLVRKLRDGRLYDHSAIKRLASTCVPLMNKRSNCKANMLEAIEGSMNPH